MQRTVIPSKTLATVQAGAFRGNLKRWSHHPGQYPPYVFEYWEDHFLIERIELPRDRLYDHDDLIRQLNEGLAVTIAKRAMGMTKPRPYPEVVDGQHRVQALSLGKALSTLPKQETRQ